MRSWTIIDKYAVFDYEGKVTHTAIQLSSSTGGYATFTEKVLGDHRHKVDDELIDLALDSFFKGEYADRAMAESVQKVDEIDLKLKEVDKVVETVNEATQRLDAKYDELDTAISEAKASTVANESMLKMMTATFNEFITSQHEGVEEDDLEEETI